MGWACEAERRKKLFLRLEALSQLKGEASQESSK